MKDLNGDVIEVGDKVAFPGPYGQSLVVGIAEKVVVGRRYGSDVHKVKVRLVGGGADYWGKEITHRDYWGNLANETYGNNPTSGIIILSKAVDNSAK